eukprot:CAMPEP_0201970466 /NCGR_PEP_ID=MMETSP0904-20121228/31066_1 /ASSEMBLY_ACC=CAM_ASM_000553 /TAXON_ID=420261 /ORGANISM="Thalassiosira antarctica, Strain CCMP982" /LENGTH=32 /DNA_ID= /DNA_START= /DNA_END= /DNA_ORIENTATION=
MADTQTRQAMARNISTQCQLTSAERSPQSVIL